MKALDQYGVKAIALFEGTKGVLMLTFVSVFILIFKADAHALAEVLITQFHLNPKGHYPRMLLMLSDTVMGAKLVAICACAYLYSAIKTFEAYGLWRHRNWGRSLGIASIGVLIPYELYELIHLYTHTKLVVLSINIAIVWYLYRRFNRASPEVQRKTSSH